MIPDSEQTILDKFAHQTFRISGGSELRVQETLDSPFLSALNSRLWRVHWSCEKVDII